MPRYEFSDEGSNKFWEIELGGSSFTVTYGKIGTKGQSQTKSFASDALARKEYDKLIAEKTKKGYRLVSGTPAPAPSPSGATGAASPATPVAPPPPKKTSASSAEAPQLRKDLYVYNEATGMLVTSRTMAGKGWDSDSKEWEKAVKNGEIIPMELVQDDTFIIRVVVGGKISDAENDEWTGRLDWKLKVPDGKLVVCGGSEYVAEECEASERAEHWSDYSRTVDVPRGEYRATLYNFFRGVNGHACLQSARGGNEPEPLGEWFRKTRPGEKFPDWLHNDCVSDLSEDPGHEAEWKKAKRIEENPQSPPVSFLLHLTPLDDGKSVPMPQLDQGWFSTPSEVREPKRIPLGLEATEIEGLPKKVEHTVTPVVVFQHTQKFPRSPLKGGPVKIPLARLERLFRIPWCCHVWTFPEIKVELPQGANFTVETTGLKNSVLKQDGGSVYAGFQSTGGQLGQIYLVAEIGKRLQALPDGSVLELDTCYYNEERMKTERPLGLHRYRGTVRGGQLEVDETFPPLDVARLEQALKLSAQVEAEKELDAGSPEIVEKVLAHLKKHPFFRENPAVAAGAHSLAMAKPEPDMLNYVAAEVFVRQFKDAFTVFDMEENERKEKESAANNPASLFGNRKALPRGDSLLKGARDREYFASDATQIDDGARKRVAEFEKEIGALGFKHAGDILLSFASHLVVRGYVDPSQTHWGVLMVGPGGGGNFEFFCYFQQGGGLTSTRNAMARDDLARDTFRVARPQATVPALWEEHLRRLAHLTAYFGPLRKLDPSAKGLAADYEGATVAFQNPQPTPRHELIWDAGAGKKLESGMLPFRRYFTVRPGAVAEGVEQMLAKADETMKAAGFSCVGDAISSFTTHYIYRGYVKDDTWAKFSCDAMNPAMNGFEFVTQFEKEHAVLCSLRAAFTKDEPKRKVYRIIAPQDSAEQLLQKHVARKAELTKKFGTPQPVKSDLISFAQELEAAAERLIG